MDEAERRLEEASPGVFEAGRGAERRVVVRWLRQQAERGKRVAELALSDHARGDWADFEGPRALADAADAIESEDHLEKEEDMTEAFRVGVYRHFKGHLVTALRLVTHHETRAAMVLYVLHETGALWVRPLKKMEIPGGVDEDTWMGFVEVEGVRRPRFVPADGKRLLEFRPGNYTHYKGGSYSALWIASHHETLFEMVVYVSHATGTLTVRPLVAKIECAGGVDADAWDDWVEHEGQRVRRFAYLGPEGGR